MNTSLPPGHYPDSLENPREGATPPNPATQAQPSTTPLTDAVCSKEREHPYPGDALTDDLIKLSRQFEARLRVMEAALAKCAEALTTCRSHRYSDGTLHHQTFHEELVSQALAATQLNDGGAKGK